MRLLMFLWLMVGAAIAQPPPPAPPPPPRFMTMKGHPLSCFQKPAFEDSGLEFFVCNGGGGLAGVRKKDDPAHMIFVGDPDIAQNLNMQVAKGQCGNGRFGVRGGLDGTMSFLCDGKDMEMRERFKTASKANWKRYEAYMHK